MEYKTDKEISDFKEMFSESRLHIIIHTFLWAITLYTMLSFLHIDIVYNVLGLLSIIILILIITRKATGQHYMIYSWICLACVMACGVAAGRLIYIEMLLPMIIYVSVLDVISFTRVGKKTTNAKLMNSNKWLPRLLVYGRSFKTGEPVVTKGYGDYLWYSITFAAIYTAYGKTIGLVAILAIIIGVLINLIIINRIYKYRWYRGFPATVGPLGLCTILLVILYII